MTVVNFELKNGGTFKIKAESENVAKCVVNKEALSLFDVENIQITAANPLGKDPEMLEGRDLNVQQKLELAKLNNYQDLYDIELSPDGKAFIITVKETSCFYPDPTVGDVIKDFGLKQGVLKEHNYDLLEERHNRTTNETHYYNYDKLRGGDHIWLPVEEVDFSNGPSGFWGRLF